MEASNAAATTTTTSPVEDVVLQRLLDCADPPAPAGPTAPADPPDKEEEGEGNMTYFCVTA